MAMDPNRAAVLLTLEHRHADGSWGRMREHGTADHDPERRWGLGRIFRCDGCSEEVRVLGPDEAPAPEHD